MKKIYKKKISNVIFFEDDRVFRAVILSPDVLFHECVCQYDGIKWIIFFKLRCRYSYGEQLVVGFFVIKIPSFFF